MTPPTKIQLIVTLDVTTSQVGVSGPLQDKIICYGMLEAARDVIRDFNPAKQAGSLVIANGAMPTSVS